MRPHFLAAACLILTGCATPPPSRHADAITKAAAVERATQEVRRRGWPLPARYTVSAERLEISQWGSPNILIFDVSFYAPRGLGAKRIELYSVTVHRVSGAIREATDMALLELPAAARN
jgi:hypothetical protein